MNLSLKAMPLHRLDKNQQVSLRVHKEKINDNMHPYQTEQVYFQN